MVKHFSTIGLGPEKDYLIENLAMLLLAGMDVLSSLQTLQNQLRSSRMKRLVAETITSLEEGSPLWRALSQAGIFAPHVISLIRLGEESGRLSQNLNLLMVEQQKERAFRSKIRSAMLYPLFVLTLTLVIGLGTAWFSLPRLAYVFTQLRLPLPLLTKLLIRVGEFLAWYGVVVVPLSLLAFLILIYLVFFFPKTKRLGEYLLLGLPGTRKLIREVEIARMGYMLGNLLDAGLPVTDALDSLANATTFTSYRSLYRQLRSHIEEGNSFQKGFDLLPRASTYIPLPVFQMIFAAERSGGLPERLVTIGKIFEEKADASTKNLAVLIEPFLLVLVWLGVLLVAIAVILPVYRLIGGLNQESTPPSPPAALIEEVSESPPAATSTLPVELPTPLKLPALGEEQREEPLSLLEILSTEVGYLNVRQTPSRQAPIITQVQPGQTFPYEAEENGWYQIVLPDGNTGWVLGTYVKVVSEP